MIKLKLICFGFIAVYLKNGSCVTTYLKNDSCVTAYTWRMTLVWQPSSAVLADIRAADRNAASARIHAMPSELEHSQWHRRWRQCDKRTRDVWSTSVAKHSNGTEAGVQCTHVRGGTVLLFARILSPEPNKRDASRKQDCFRVVKCVLFLIIIVVMMYYYTK